ncbi:DUF2752 domain-containing protein [bacterium]|nr:DUF2752 domain-containing protein [bacterium]
MQETIPRAIPIRSNPNVFRWTLAAMVATGWIGAWMLPWDVIWRVPMCVFRSVTGLPCPFCHMTHACVYFAHGQFWLALKTNAMGPAFMLGSLAVLFGSLKLILANSPPINWAAYWARNFWVRPALVVIWLINWAFLVVRAIK